MNTTLGQCLRRRQVSKQEPGGIKIDAHPEIEIRFCLTADHRRQMKNGRGFRIDNAVQHLRIGKIAANDRNAWIRKSFDGNDIE